MIHESDPTIQILRKLRAEGKIPCPITIRENKNKFSLVDNEGVTHGNYDSRKEADKALKKLKKD